MKLFRIVEKYGYHRRENGQENIEISGVSYDSRKTQPGDLLSMSEVFSERWPRFAAAAQKAGAAVIVAEEMLPDIGIRDPYEGWKKGAIGRFRQFLRPSVGSDAGIRRDRDKRQNDDYVPDEGDCGRVGEKSAAYWVLSLMYAGGQRFESINTTPESFELQRMFAEMHQKYDTHICAMEVSLLTLWLFPAQRISLSITVYLPISRRIIIWIFTRTLKIITMPRKNCFCRRQSAVINIDDPYGKRLSMS